MNDRLRKILDGIKNFDDAYSEKIVNMYMGDGKVENPVQGAAAGLASIYLGGTPYSKMNDHPAYKVSAHTSGAAKYAAPIVGVTLAGKGIMDLTQQFQQTDSTLDIEG
jgi:hypothetical protein